jgi:hypothetical protein
MIHRENGTFQALAGMEDLNKPNKVEHPKSGIASALSAALRSVELLQADLEDLTMSNDLRHAIQVRLDGITASIKLAKDSAVVNRSGQE